jgi:ribosomal 50S subunit-recycling heat shock protein
MPHLCNAQILVCCPADELRSVCPRNSNQMRGVFVKKLLVGTIAALFTLSMGGMVMAEDKATMEKPVMEKPAMDNTMQKPSVEKAQTREATATVKAIDLKKRIVTLTGSEGKVFDVKVGEEAKNLPQVKVGDLVTVTYYESIAVKVYKKGEAPKADGMTEGVITAAPGQKPEGVKAAQVTVTATVEALDKIKQTATLKLPDGKSISVKVKDPKNMENVKVGDEVVITYSEALAISVVSAKKS